MTSSVIKTWSFSRLQDFETCKFKAFLKYVEKAPEPERTIPEGKLEHPLDRGNRVHTAAEIYVKEDIELIDELRHFKEDFNALKIMYTDKKVQLEEEWAMDKAWQPTEWACADTWLRLKLDAFIKIDDYNAVVIDYKTGKRFGNEVKHAEQGQLYQLVSFLRYPELQSITVEFWYVDINDIARTVYSRDQGLNVLGRFTERGNALVECTNFTPNPNIYSCKYCPYGPKGNKICPAGV